MARMRRIHVSLIGGEHQFLHIVPVAAWLSRQDGVSVRLFAANARAAQAASEMMRQLDAGPFACDVLDDAPAPRLWRKLFRKFAAKPVALLGSSRRLRACDAMLVSERTTALLARMPGRQPLYIRFTHGVGDREKGFNRKARIFDYFIVAGAKYVDRFVEEGIAPRDHIFTCGYLKIPALRRIKGDAAGRKLFANDRPTIVYNAHFDESVGSWSLWGQQAIKAILADGRWNLIVAPHMRLLAHADAAERARWQAYASAGRCIVDPGSHASTDMTYIDAADIYLGDVSSQVYEFLSTPRPCVFLNAHHAAWREDENYRNWALGDVVGDVAELIPALERAMPGHEHYRPRQEQAIRYALGDMGGDPAERAGQRVLALIGDRS